MIGLQKLVAEIGDFSLGPITFELNAGEHALLVGPSGAGKSLLIEVIAGLRPIKSGTLLIDHQEATSLPPNKRQLGWAPQTHNLFPHLSARENLAFPLRIAKKSKASIDDSIRNMADRLRLLDLLNKHPGLLSGGERQRVALGRALLSQPKVLILDEAFSSLDQRMRTETRNWVCQNAHEHGLTLIEVSHDESTILEHSGQCLRIQDGKHAESNV